MPATLRDLTSPAFGLRAINETKYSALDRPLLWAHSSDLPDPTPWLDTGGLLLTDGVQFSGASATDARSYVDRLVAQSVLALGFATGIVHERIPDALVDAATKVGLMLFEVPRETPFMAVIRFVSDAVAKDDRETLEKSLRSQRSVARAALRPDALAEILRELEQTLGCWVALFDASGGRIRIATRLDMPSSLSGDVTDAVRQMLDSGRTAAARLSLASTAGTADEVTLQTLGGHGELRGVLAVGTGTGALDRARADLVDAVIALASIALEQSRTLDDARRRLRSGVLELLLAGMTDVARRTVGPLWGQLPPEPIRVACIVPHDPSGQDGTSSLRSALDLLAGERAEALFFAEQDAVVVTITGAENRGGLRDAIARGGWRAGFSSATEWDDLTAALREARTALSRTDRDRRVQDFDELAHSGLLGHLERTNAQEIARRMLAPLEAPGAQEGLRPTLEVWLDHNGAWDPAAKELGMHRHTLRARIETAAGLLGLDLSTFAGRAEVWSALQLTQHTSAPRPVPVSRSGGSPG